MKGYVQKRGHKWTVNIQRGKSLKTSWYQSKEEANAALTKYNEKVLSEVINLEGVCEEERK